MKHAWKLPSLRASTIPTPPDLLAQREAMKSSPPWEPDPKVAVAATAVGGVSCVVCEPPDADSVSLYFHGGGYRLGSATWSIPFATRFATATRSTAYVVDYRLAPEHPFPACIHDAATVYEHLLAAGHGTIVAAGDSAGGGVAAALTVAAASSGVPIPAGLVLMSAWLDLTCTAETYTSRAESDQLFSLDSATRAAGLYLQGHDPTDPLASPALARLDPWPPSILIASTDEVLLDDSIRLASSVALSRAPLVALLERERPHAWPAVFPDLPESTDALAHIGAFYQRLVHPGGS